MRFLASIDKQRKQEEQSGRCRGRCRSPGSCDQRLTVVSGLQMGYASA
jgi:hypothetical protein